MWIKVTDGLPEGKEWKTFSVVIKSQDGCRSVRMASFIEKWDANDDDPGYPAHWSLEEGELMPFEVTHWMKMPKLPEVINE